MEIKKIKQMLTEWNKTRSISLGSEILEQLVKDFGIKEKKWN